MKIEFDGDKLEIEEPMINYNLGHKSIKLTKEKDGKKLSIVLEKKELEKISFFLKALK